MKIEETIREDGLHIISCRVPSKKVWLELIAGVGSAYDPIDKDGYFHFFEHMAFRGTASRSAEEIASFAEKNLLWRNAYTARTETAYMGEAVYTKFQPLCDLLCDLYFNSAFPPEEFEKEREVILNEIARDNDEDRYVSLFALWKALWQKNPLRKFGVGTPEGIGNTRREEIMQTQREWYIPSNTTVLGIGNLTHNDLVREVSKRIPRNSTLLEYQSWSDEYDTPPSTHKVIIKRPQREKATITIGCKFPLITHDERIRTVEKLLTRLLVQSKVSGIWKELREKRGIVYTTHGAIENEPPLGSYFYAAAENLPQKTDEVIEVMTSTLTSPLNDQKAFQEIKEAALDRITLGYDHLSQWSQLIHERLQAGEELKDLEHIFRRKKRLTASVSLDEVEALRASTLKPEKLVTVVIKPS